MATAKKSTAPASGMRRYKVNPDRAVSQLKQLCYGQDCYSIKNGEVELPTGHNWYQYMVDAGDLLEIKAEEAETKPSDETKPSGETPPKA